MDICFSHHKLAKFSSNTGQIHFEGLVQLLIFIKGNKNLGLKYYARIKGAPLSDLLIKASIKTKKQLMVFFDSIWYYCP